MRKVLSIFIASVMVMMPVQSVIADELVELDAVVDAGGAIPDETDSEGYFEEEEDSWEEECFTDEQGFWEETGEFFAGGAFDDILEDELFVGESEECGDGLGVYIEDTFTDPNFRAYVKENFDSDKDGYLSDAEIDAVDQIFVDDKGIKSLEGISLFSNLYLLSCGSNQLTSLDLSKNEKLLHVTCQNNQLSQLVLGSNPNLALLYCYLNNLSSLDVSKQINLDRLVCGNNNLNAIDVSNNKNLRYFHCDGNNLDSLNISNNTKLTHLICAGNNISQLDISNNPSLYHLICSGNNLSALDISNNTNLSYLSCDINSINSLDISNCPSLIESYQEGTVSIMGDCCSYSMPHTPTDDDEDDQHLLLIDSTVRIMGVDNPAAERILIDKTHFPDDNFRSYIKDEIDKDKDGYLSDAEINAVVFVTVDAMNISSLSGIEYFPNLKVLNCVQNNIKSLDVSHNSALGTLCCNGNKLESLDIRSNTALIGLNCSDNQLSSLDISQNPSLVNIVCDHNQLTSLDVSHATGLIYLNCYENPLTSLDVSHNTALADLSCSGTNLTNLDVTNNHELEYLNCAYSKIAKLDLTNNTKLIRLYCHSNQLTSLDLSQNAALVELMCDDNQLTKLDVRHITKLTRLMCDTNQLTDLDISQCPLIEQLSCHDNQLTNLDVNNHTKLERLWCSENKLNRLQLSGCTVLKELECRENQLGELDVSDCASLCELWCDDNQLTNLDVSNNAELMDLRCTENQLKTLDISHNSWLLKAFLEGVKDYYEENYYYNYFEGLSGMADSILVVDDFTIVSTGEEHTHTLEPIPAKEATCTETGLTEGEKCSECGEITKVQETIPALEHNWGEWTVTKEATENEDGIETRKCSRCEVTETRPIAKTSHIHTPELIPAKGATCTETGLTEGEKCSECGEITKVQETIPALEHNWGEWTVTKEATEIEEGTESRECSRCKATETRPIAKTSHIHTPEPIPAKEATCTEAGLTEGEKCSDCGDILKVQETIPALGHTWGEWKVKKEATETEEGIEARTCSKCSKEETRPIEKKPTTPEQDQTIKGDVAILDMEFQYGQSEARTMLDMINAFRQSSDAWAWDETNTQKVQYTGLQPLQYDYNLEKVAMQRAAEIVLLFSHTRPNGLRCFSAGGWGTANDLYGNACGENIAYGQTSANSVFVSWREDNYNYNGQGHRRNMLDPGFKSVGISHVYYNGTHFWVQEFGTRTDSSPTGAVDSSRIQQIEFPKDSFVGYEVPGIKDGLTLEYGSSGNMPASKVNAIVGKATIPVAGSVTWSGNDETVAKIQDGKLVGVGIGETSLKGTYKEAQFACVLKVIPADVSKAKIDLSYNKQTFNGNAFTPGLTVTMDGKTLTSGKDYTVAYSNNVNAGTATVTITGKGNYTGTSNASFTIEKADNTLTVKTKAPSVKATKTSKKKQAIKKAKAFSVTDAQGKVTYKKKSGSKKLLISSAGKISVAKGTAKGTYKIKVNVTAAGNTNYNPTTKTVTVKVKVK